MTDRPDIARFEASLKRHIGGEVRFDNGSRALYTTDASSYRQVPIGVVLPRTTDDVIAAVAIAREYGSPLLNRGAGTSIAGQCCNEALVLDYSKYLNRIVEIDPEARLARVEPGIVLDTLRDAAAIDGLTFGPDPATHRWCTMGGMIGNNSCGVHSIMAGRTVDNVHSLRVLLYDGTVLTVGKNEISQTEIRAKLKRIAETYGDEIRNKFPPIPRRVSGYSIDQLLPENDFHVARSLVGSEGTLVTILEATVHLIPSRPKRVLLVLGFEDLFTAGDRVPAILEHKPIGLEGFDERFLRAVRTKGLQSKSFPEFPRGMGWLMVEFGADTVEEAQQMAEMCSHALNQEVVDARIYRGTEQQAVWAVRDSALGAISRVPGQPDNWEGWEDAAVAPANIGAYLRDFQKLLADYGYSAAMYGHIGDGCLHNRIDWDPKSEKGIEQWRRFVDDAADLVLRYGGSLSGEHGDGQARGELLPKMFGPEIMQAFEEFKTIWDPDWKMNPGKLFRPNKIIENLRYGPQYHPPILPTNFQFPDDAGSFSRATERCVGAGVCRREQGGIMCPSYRATRDEEHVTRGRTHLLWEMMHGDVITDGWKSDAIRESLDLCLACKGCKSECPVRVDVATYKSEFLSHYYEGKLRPRAAYTMGMIHRAARIASRIPSVVNFLTQTPVLRTIAKKIAGIHPARSIPKFARQSFRQWFFHRQKQSSHLSSGKMVILWADTFNNYFRVETAKAAVKVLEKAGFSVKVYEQSLCCGRPLYDWGMLQQAKKLLDEILSVTAQDISLGVPIVVLEPSCASVFKDELINLMPEREDARRLADHVYLLSEFLEAFAPKAFAPNFLQSHSAKPTRKALVQLHCHHQTIFGSNAEQSVLNKSGVDAEILDAGCCGMAGAFGFEKDKYDISMKIAKTKLLPKIEAENPETVILTNGFSCREQLEQSIGVTTKHIAEFLSEMI